MNRHLGIALVSLSLLVACKSKKNDTPPQETSSEDVVVESASTPEVDATPEKVDIDAKDVDAWLAERKAKQAVLKDYLTKVGELEKKKAGAVESVGKVGAWTGEIDEKLKDIEKGSGLTPREREVLDDLANTVATVFLVYTDEAVASLEPKKEDLEKMEPDARAAYEKQMAEMKQSMLDQRNLKDHRAKYGDAAVEVVLAKKDDITKSWKEAVEATK